jgi:hypothetical protein
MHPLAGGKFKRAIFASNAPGKTLDGTNNGALRGFFQVPVRCAMDWKCEMGWEEKIMLGTGIFVFPSLAGPNCRCPVESHWGYVITHFYAPRWNWEMAS